MIYSMTAFSRQEAHGAWGTAIWEIRAINHRYLEIGLKLPDAFGALEPLLRDLVRKSLPRGKIECSLRYRHNDAQTEVLQVNIPLVEQLMKAGRQVTQQVQHSSPMAILDILAWPGVIQTAEFKVSDLQTPILALFEQTLQDLVAMRQREGAALKAILDERLSSMAKIVRRARVHLPDIIRMQREKILTRFNELKIDLDISRLEQEMILFVHRTDVAEELDRLEIHMNEVRHALDEKSEQKGAQGRRLDFLMQELNREANTFGSKSTDPEMTTAAVDLKVLIEQMREQIQNIE
jgi:uncharacterized protein (TIGR00255 family)